MGGVFICWASYAWAPPLMRFFEEARLFWNQALTVFVSLRWMPSGQRQRKRPLRRTCGDALRERFAVPVGGDHSGQKARSRQPTEQESVYV